MEFGLSLAPFNPGKRLFLGDYRRIVLNAKDAGFRSVVTGENYVSYPNWTPPPVPLLCALSGDLAPEMQAVIGITLLTMRNPVIVAEEITVLDHAMGGDLRVAVGIGWREAVFQALGFSKQGSARRLVDNVGILRSLWSGEPVTFESPYCRLDNARSAEVPIQAGGPPLWLAGNVDKAVIRAAQIGDSWLLSPHTKLSVLNRQFQLFSRERDAAGRPPVNELALRRDVFMSGNGQSAWEQAEATLGPMYETLLRWGHGKTMPADDSLEFPFDSLAAGRFLIGSPDEVLEGVRSCEAALPISHLIVRLGYPGMATDEFCTRIQEFGRHVISRYSAAA